jgi:aspartyl aminopeptidase
MTEAGCCEDLLRFLGAAPTPYHAVAELSLRLTRAGFQGLNEAEEWQLDSGGRYFVIRNGSLIAFARGGADPLEAGWRMVGAHTDSPCLKIKPQPESVRNGCVVLGVEVYGGALLNPWFDRNLSLAGRVSFRAGTRVQSALVDFQRALATIPSLAIHLDREANEKHPVNPQQHLPVILAQGRDGANFSLRDLLLKQLREQHPDARAEEVLDYDLSLYDTQAPALAGLNGEFLCGARLDNLLSCHAAVRALSDRDGDFPCLVVLNDHEEVGSRSHAGALGPFLRAVLERLCGTPLNLQRALHRSLLVSSDNAHGIHPNYADRHDPNHAPMLNGGPAIKVNTGQRYATTGETAAMFREICRRANVPVQDFVMRSDLACGSTIGPITAAEIGVRTVDVGVPQWAMHSIRETAGAKDVEHLYNALREFFRTENLD